MNSSFITSRPGLPQLAWFDKDLKFNSHDFKVVFPFNSLLAG